MKAKPLAYYDIGKQTIKGFSNLNWVIDDLSAYSDNFLNDNVKNYKDKPWAKSKLGN